MDELDATDLELIARFRAQESPSQDVVERVFVGVRTQIAAQGARSVREWLRDGALTVAIAACALLAIRLVGMGLEGRQTATPVTAPDVAPPTQVEVVAPAPPPTERSAQVVPPAPIDVPQAPLPAPKRERRSESREEAPVAVDAETLAAELVLVQRAKRAKDPSARLAALALHAERFPRGVLTEEREVLRVEALCELDRLDEARAAMAAFTRAHPRSAFAGRVGRSCAGARP